MNFIEVKYTSFACPPETISTNTIYKIGLDKNGYYLLLSNENKIYHNLEYFKMLFTPIRNKWSDLAYKSKR